MVALAALREWRPVERPQEPARLDPITSLPNRRQFQADSADWGNARSTLVLITLADAQAFNEILRVLGHARSDAFIRAGAARLIEILGPGTRIYHVNILSFAFRLPGHAEPDPPAMIARIAEGFRRPILCDDVPIDTRIGIGLKALGRGSPGEDLRATLSAAQDSRSARTGWSWFDQKSDEAHRRAFRLLSDLKHALDAEGQLELHYQPKVTLDTGACISAEALLRWTHPELGPVSPGEFVELAEKTALVTPMTRWVVDAATRQAAVWARDGPRPVARGQRLAEEPRGARLRRVPALLLRRPRRRPGADRARDHRRRQRRPRRPDPRPAGGAPQPRLLHRHRRLRLRLLEHELPDPPLGAHAQDRPEPGARGRGRHPRRPPRLEHRADGPRPRLPHGGRGHRDRGRARAPRPAGAATMARAGTSAGRCRRRAFGDWHSRTRP